MALTFALIASVQSVLYRVYRSNETIPNAPKHYETRQNMSYGHMSGLGALVAKNSDATSCHELLH